MNVFESRDEIQREQISLIQLLEELAKNQNTRRGLRSAIADSHQPIECNFYK